MTAEKTDEDIYDENERRVMPRIGSGEIGRAIYAPQGLRVTVRQKNLNREWVTEDVEWPKGWPLPEQGAVFQGHTLQGWIEHLEYDVTTLRVTLVLR